MQQDPSPVHCLSFDIEEHFQVSAFESPIRRRHWDSFESRVEKNTLKILEVLGERGVRATFFILGWVADRHPDLVRRISNCGHEIASHGYAHELIPTLSSSQFREDIRKTKRILEDLSGHSVLGYRAPSFSIIHESSWALSILIEEGYFYDSSIFPALHRPSSIPNVQPTVHWIKTTSGNLLEIPPTTVRIAGLRLPAGGGGYLRILPFFLFQYFLSKVAHSGEVLVLYLHPWELDPSQPRMRGPLLSRFRHYANLDRTQDRLQQLLELYHFGAVRDVVPGVAEEYSRINQKAEESKQESQGCFGQALVDSTETGSPSVSPWKTWVGLPVGVESKGASL